MSTPADAPPSYEAATAPTTSSSKPQTSSHLEVPEAKNGIPAQARRSMEDLQRPLPQGWVRQYDAKENHQFFVNTKANPPQSYWEHPLDIPEVVRSLSSEERERLQEEENHLRKQYPASTDHSEDESSHHNFPPLPERPSTSASSSKTEPKKSFGEKLKDKVTGMTHEERVKERQLRAQEEQQYYEAHLKLRQAMQQAQITGQPQFFARDRDGKEIWVEPPNYGYGSYSRGYGVNPFTSGLYANPNVRFIRPSYPYNRPYGTYGGGGYGLPVAGGLLGGLLLGGLLF